jgi:hypothetical protein
VTQDAHQMAFGIAPDALIDANLKILVTWRWEL